MARGGQGSDVGCVRPLRTPPAVAGDWWPSSLFSGVRRMLKPPVSSPILTLCRDLSRTSPKEPTLQVAEVEERSVATTLLSSLPLTDPPLVLRDPLMVGELKKKKRKVKIKCWGPPPLSKLSPTFGCSATFLKLLSSHDPCNDVSNSCPKDPQVFSEIAHEHLFYGTYPFLEEDDSFIHIHLGSDTW